MVMILVSYRIYLVFWEGCNIQYPLRLRHPTDNKDTNEDWTIISELAVPAERVLVGNVIGHGIQKTHTTPAGNSGGRQSGYLIRCHVPPSLFGGKAPCFSIGKAALI